MSHYLLIWDHPVLGLWRKDRGGAQLVAEAQAETVEEVIGFIEHAPIAGLVLTLRVAVDATWVEQHLERLPPARGKLLDDLVRRRLEKRGGPEAADHHWALRRMPADYGPPTLRLVVSLPPALNTALARFCDRHGVALLGVHSLALAIGMAVRPENKGLRALRFGLATHVAAYASDGAHLYSIRAPGEAPVPDALARVARRLALFVDQEIHEKGGQFSTATELGPSEEISVDELWAALARGPDLLPRRVHRARIFFRARLFALALALLALVPALDFLSRGLSRRAAAELARVSAEAETVESVVRARKAETALALLRRQGVVVDFASGRAADLEAPAADSPLLVATHFVASVVPDTLELDRISLRLDPADRAIRIVLAGRPLKLETNVDTQLDLYLRELAYASFKTVDVKREMLRGRAGRFSAAESASRQFQIDLKLKDPK